MVKSTQHIKIKTKTEGRNLFINSELTREEYHIKKRIREIAIKEIELSNFKKQ